MIYRFLICLTLVFTVVACAPTFYQKTYEFNKALSESNYDQAAAFMAASKKMETGRLEFLYYVNYGMVTSLQREFDQSNQYFQKADIFVEDHKKSVLEEGGALLLNPNLTTYPGEDHEKLMVNYFKALNYLEMRQYNEALVECKRMNIRLNQLSDKYKSDKKYKKDAFIHVMMGIIYEAFNDPNNAFIAYRNALDIYENDYAKLFKTPIPQQLKLDLVRTAQETGLWDDADKYAKKFGIENKKDEAYADLVLLWNNGMSPVKDEWGINFAIIQGSNGWVTFVNKDLGLTFPYYAGKDQPSVSWIRAVFPKYVERKSFYKDAIVMDSTGNKYGFSFAEDINAISFKVLEERMLLEFSKTLLRVALKQSVAAKVSQENEGWGAALSIIGSATESADTRSWQSLPKDISYSRIPLVEGQTSVEIELTTLKGTKEKRTIQLPKFNKGERVVLPYYTLTSFDAQTSSQF
ncbi:COG3014 family protein [Flammeovirga kamogawensis]|uniref:Tetratricopeptide repeat protein n=1 Tax=Flammeovirga kamogawensis TaxID=373891 RepID=A0ABX8GSL8_9BACT|nr:hypothetical protein [Flammeovirga kamogawensis]MBB6463897.1 hypothetical protein [Flammeovirga kamogawensis]QWG06579.1 hypothetical protein KM029_14805 [Flammeovirga kamogawensis]TRX68405.1 hypothetical protein EO216_09805 [Flammeovirga kamogawensis]